MVAYTGWKRDYCLVLNKGLVPSNLSIMGLGTNYETNLDYQGLTPIDCLC